MGKIGDHPVRMMLNLNAATGRFDGAYGYNDQLGTLTLNGTMLPEGAGVDLDERNKQGHVTGHFSLRFFQPRPAWESLANYKKNPCACSCLSGSWRSHSGGATENVELGLDGEIVLANAKARALNELIAYKLRTAILNNDAKAFASLLQYPFYTAGMYQHYTIWNTPADVIKDYDKIILFSDDLVRDSVPHFLETADQRSFFMNGSVLITNGKVNMICDGACPNIPVGVNH